MPKFAYSNGFELAFFVPTSQSLLMNTKKLRYLSYR